MTFDEWVLDERLQPRGGVPVSSHQENGASAGSGAASAAWLGARDVARLRSHWQRSPVTLAGGSPLGRWPARTDASRWLRADRLDADRMTLWRSGSRMGDGCEAVPAGEWTRERRLGEELLTGLPNLDAVGRVMDRGGWLHLRDLHRIDPGAADGLSCWQEALGMPLRVHAWWGRGSAGNAPSERRASRGAGVELAPSEAASARFLIVTEGALAVEWTAPATQDAAVAPFARLTAGAGDVVYLPAGERLSLAAHGTTWVIELRLTPLTPVAMLEGVGRTVLQALGEDVAMRRCAVRPGGTARDGAAPADLDVDVDQGGHVYRQDTHRFACALREALVPGAVQAAAREHLSWMDESNTASRGRLSALSVLFEADGQTLLSGRPWQVTRRQKLADAVVVTLARKVLRFGLPAEPMLQFLLRAEPYRLDEAPGRYPLSERLALARQLAAEGLVVRSSSR